MQYAVYCVHSIDWEEYAAYQKIYTHHVTPYIARDAVHITCSEASSVSYDCMLI